MKPDIPNIRRYEICLTNSLEEYRIPLAYEYNFGTIKLDRYIKRQF